MQTDFQLLFSVNVMHSYFENNICKCLYFVPDQDTENIMSRYGFKIRQKINGFDFFSGNSTAIADFLNYIKSTMGKDYFNFSIQSSNEDFGLLTELPADWLWEMSYDSKDVLNSYDGTNVLMHLTLTAQTPGASVGNLKLYFDDILANGNENSKANYIINLQARSTQWQYYIINQNSVPLNNPGINGKGDITFKGPETVKLENNEEALFFYSDPQELPLSQVPVYKFDLVDSGSDKNVSKKKSAGNVIFKGLPNPDPSSMGTVIIDGKTRLTSPMYIYI